MFVGTNFPEIEKLSLAHSLHTHLHVAASLAVPGVNLAAQ